MGKVIEFRNYDTETKNQEKNKRKENNYKKRTNKLFVMIGIPCSGKSTYVKEYLNSTNTITVSTDEIRKKLTGTYKFSSENNAEIVDMARNEIQEGLTKGFDVVFDATNTNKKYRKDILKISKLQDIQAIAVVLKTPLQLCIKRNSERSMERKVPVDILIKISSFNSVIEKQEGFYDVLYVN